MRQFQHDTALAFDDILLVPKGGVPSRADVDLSMNIGSISLEVPVISSPMATITEFQMAQTMADHGGIGIIHRYMSPEDQKEIAVKVGMTMVGAAIGLDDNDRFDTLAQYVDVICIDVANGHDPRLPDYIRHLKMRAERLNVGGIHIMAGNVSTYDGYIRLAMAGADSVRVGIGGGSVCSTRIVSGHGVPTLASLLDIGDRKVAGCGVIADGGIRTPGDAVKAFAAGADAVMLGGMLAGTDETPGSAVDGYKLYAGMASEAYTNKVEGAAVMVPEAGPAEKVLDKIFHGLRSGCSYSGVYKLSDLHKYAEYVTVSNHGSAESKPHALTSQS